MKLLKGKRLESVFIICEIRFIKLLHVIGQHGFWLGDKKVKERCVLTL